MKHRWLVLLGGLTAVLVATVIALQGMAETLDSKAPSNLSSRTRETTSLTGPAVPVASYAISDRTIKSIAIADAGTVVVGRVDDDLNVMSATPSSGWTSVIEVVTGQRVEGIFWNYTMGVRYGIELDRNELDISIEIWDGTAGPTEEAHNRTPTAGQNKPNENLIRPESGDNLVGAPDTSLTVASPSVATQATATTRPSTTTTAPTTTTTAPPTTTTAPTTTTTDPVAPTWTTLRLDSPGGSITIAHQPGRVWLESAIPASGFVIEDVDERTNRVEVKFERDDLTFTLKARWTGEGLVTDVESGGDD